MKGKDSRLLAKNNDELQRKFLNKSGGVGSNTIGIQLSGFQEKTGYEEKECNKFSTFVSVIKKNVLR